MQIQLHFTSAHVHYIDDALHLICLLNNGKFDVYSLPDGGKVLDGVSLLEYVMGDISCVYWALY